MLIHLLSLMTTKNKDFLRQSCSLYIKIYVRKIEVQDSKSIDWKTLWSEIFTFRLAFLLKTDFKITFFESHDMTHFGQITERLHNLKGRHCLRETRFYLWNYFSRNFTSIRIAERSVVLLSWKTWEYVVTDDFTFKFFECNITIRKKTFGYEFKEICCVGM